MSGAPCSRRFWSEHTRFPKFAGRAHTVLNGCGWGTHCSQRLWVGHALFSTVAGYTPFSRAVGEAHPAFNGCDWVHPVPGSVVVGVQCEGPFFIDQIRRHDQPRWLWALVLNRCRQGTTCSRVEEGGTHLGFNGYSVLYGYGGKPLFLIECVWYWW